MKFANFSFLLAFMLMVNFVFAQSQSTITIKTVTIENGDTVVTERSYNSDGNGIILDDSIFGQDDHFIFFNNDYGLDTNFTQNFHDIFSREMKDFFRDFNNSGFDMPENNIEFFNKKFPLDMDTAFSKEYDFQMIPRDTAKAFPDKPLRKTDISTENIILPYKQPITDYSVVSDPDDYAVKIVFQLNPKKVTQLLLKDEKQKVIYKEKMPKASDMYTRLLDMNAYQPGTYILEVKQGKNCSASRIIAKKNNNQIFQF
jgi:hypothetical protein